MERLLITIFLGWLGIHKFIDRKIVMGIIYLCTLGLFGIGWVIDIIIAFFHLFKPPQNQSQPENMRTISYHKTFNVAGVTFKCKLNEDVKRQEILEYCKTKDRIHLEQYEYKGEPAFLIVLDKNNLDIGTVPANIVPTILKYKDRDTSVEFTEVSYFQPEGKRKEINYAKVQFLVYKDN